MSRYRYDTVVSTLMGIPPVESIELQPSSKTFDPPVVAPAGHGRVHGIAAGSTDTDCADDKSLLSQVFAICSELAFKNLPPL